MTLLALLAILFAIPTYGLSIVALIVFAMVRGYLRGVAAKTKERYDDAMREARDSIERGDYLKPGWIANKSAQNVFESAIYEAAVSEGLTKSQIDRLFGNKETVACVMAVAASFEKYKFSRVEQIVGATDYATVLAKKEYQRLKNGTPSLVQGYDEAQKLCDAGQRLFAEGKYTHAFYAFTDALEKHEISIAYSMRAEIYAHRIRHYEALQDLLKAESISDTSSQKIKGNLQSNIEICTVLCHAYGSNLRNELINEVRGLDKAVLPHRLLSSWLDIDVQRWWEGDFDHALLEHYYFRELHSITTFDEFEHYQEVLILADRYPAGFIEGKAGACPNEKAFKVMKMKSESLLCSLDEQHMYDVRTAVIVAAHEKLMVRDSGAAGKAVNVDSTANNSV